MGWGLGMKSGLRPGDAMRNCDEVSRGRTRFGGAEVFTIWGSFKKKACKIMYKIAHLDTYLGWENKSQPTLDALKIQNTFFWYILGNFPEFHTQILSDWNLASPPAPQDPSTASSNSQRPASEGPRGCSFVSLPMNPLWRWLGWGVSDVVQIRVQI